MSLDEYSTHCEIEAARRARELSPSSLDEQTDPTESPEKFNHFDQVGKQLKKGGLVKLIKSGGGRLD